MSNVRIVKVKGFGVENVDTEFDIQMRVPEDEARQIALNLWAQRQLMARVLKQYNILIDLETLTVL